MNKKLKFKRVLLKLSGEYLSGSSDFGICPKILSSICSEVKYISSLGVELAIVVGGGNIFRGKELLDVGISRVSGDHMGMLATAINSIAISDYLKKIKVKSKVMSSIPLNGVCDTYVWSEAINSLESGSVLIFAAGTGNPFFSTDSAACLRAVEINADVVLKATKVDGVYSEDPCLNKNAKRFERLSYDFVLKNELKVMDLSAFTLARDHGMPIFVFNINSRDSLRDLFFNLEKGTLIEEQ